MKRDTALVVLAVVLAVVGSTYALLGPTGSYSETESTPGGQVVERTGSTTLLGQIRSGEEDAAIVFALAIPVLISLLPLLLARTRAREAAQIGSAALLLLFALVTGFSVGLFFLPSAAAMLAAVVVSGNRADRGPSRTPRARLR